LEVLQHFVSDDTRCSYLPDQTARLDHLLLMGITPDILERFLERGWRRFGAVYFRPVCTPCRECVPIRLPADRFAPSRSQLRARNRNRLRLEIGKPQVTPERIALCNRWQTRQGSRRAWDNQEMDERRYFLEFGIPHPAAMEFAYYDDAGGESRLVAVGLVDRMPNAVSAVYTYYDPEYASQSPGTRCILDQVDYARTHGLAWVYLGYRVIGCPSSEYKARFQPHQLLNGRPGPDDQPDWIETD